ncbi:MAG: methionyl-tRNA formyltransferase [Alphaproteobacteria bacterium]|nr:methionyl-tRNA formyltransferase [Alphaproteobacteria bacterium]
MKIVFMGTPEFAVPSLRALHQDHDIEAVYSQPPRPSGRGMKLRPSPVHAAAHELGLDVKTPLSFKDEADVAALAALAPDVLVVVAYGLILPQAVLDIPRLMPVNGHASILPRWRGAAPIHRAIAAGDSETGVTTMKMEAGLDTGPMLKLAKTAITPTDTTGRLHDRLAMMTADLLAETLSEIPADQLTLTPQPEDGVTWADKITPGEAAMDFTQSAAEIDRRVRAFSPFPGAWLALGQDADGNTARLKVKAVAVRDAAGQDEVAAAGKVIGAGPEGGPLIRCRDGAIELITVQPQGKAAMSGRDFLNGNVLRDVMASPRGQ